jgi:DNA-binding response OmpR family regulator
MLSGKPVRPGEQRPPRILVVDDDRRVVELLDLALSAHGFQVLTANDGEDALRQALDERPDLVVLDVRLPRKGGLDVCEAIRRDPEDGAVPIILVSASAETETRIQGFARGADDYLGKPFSPKELIARVKRLLARSAESREARRRAQQLERELTRAQDELRRAHGETRREQRMRELAFELGRELHGSLDIDQVAARFLLAAQSRLGTGMVALLAPEGGSGSLTPLAVRGDGFERLSGIEVARGGELMSLLEGLARPVLRRDLDRFPELAAEIQPLVAAGMALVAPLRGGHGLEGLLLADERMDGAEFDGAQLEIAGGLCEIAAGALHNARVACEQMERALSLCGAPPRGRRTRALRAEAAAIADRAARACGLPPRQRALLAHAVRLGPWALSEPGRRALEALGAEDPTGRIADLKRMLERAIGRATAPDDTLPDDRRALLLLSIALRHVDERAAGLAVERALLSTIAWTGDALDAATHRALTIALRERLESERDVRVVSSDALEPQPPQSPAPPL